MSVVSPPGYQQASSYAAADDRRNIVSAMAQRSIRDTFNTGARGGWVVGKLPSWSASGWAVTISPCTGVVENTFASNAGEYVTLNTANQLLTHTSSSGTLNRIDIVGCVVDDAFYSGTLNDAKLEILQGTAVSGTPSAPAIPNTFLPIYQASIPAGSSTPTITTMVKVTTAAGGVPIITTAQLADPGGFVGEMRGIQVATSPFPTVLYSYYGSDSLWHGIQSVDGFAQAWQNGTSNITLAAWPTYTALITVTIPDPGFAYYLQCGAQAQVSIGSAWSIGGSTNPPLTDLQITLTSVSGTVISNTQFPGTLPFAGGSYYGQLAKKKSAKLTGSQTVYLSASNNPPGTGGTQTALYSPFTGAQTYLDVMMIPA
jgi:hypothetical protein